MAKDYSNPTPEDLEKYRREREKEAEGGRKGGKIGGPKGRRPPKQDQ